MKLNHLSIILDGNRRWAVSKNLPPYEGHKKGAENLWDLIENVKNYKLKYLTVFVFSTENWKRSNSETSYLVSLLGIYLDDIISRKKEINIKIRFIGDMSIFNKKIQDKLSFIENFTHENLGLTVTLALNYGGRNDILQAVNEILRRKKKFSSIREEDFKKFTLNFDVPYPDLLIRTGGEMRVSNFLLWDLAYTELIFLKEMWPDFNKSLLDKCVLDYEKRVRNHGV